MGTSVLHKRTSGTARPAGPLEEGAARAWNVLNEGKPFIDPLSFVQLELLRRLRAPGGEAEQSQLVRASLLAINGIAGGLRNTG